MPNITFAQRNAQLDAHNAALLIRIALETSTSDTPIHQAKGATAAGDERKLRGIPCLAQGVGNTIHGTDPLRALLAKQPRDQ